MPRQPDDMGAWQASVNRQLRDLTTMVASIPAGPSAGRTLLATLTIADPVASVSYTVPQTWRHLSIEVPYVAAEGAGFFHVRFNGDSGGNYASLVEYVFADPGTDGLGGAWNDPFVILAPIGPTHATSQAKILDYTSAVAWKSYVSSGMNASATATEHGMSSSVGAWKNTDPIETVEFAATSGDLTGGLILIYGDR